MPTLEFSCPTCPSHHFRWYDGQRAGHWCWDAVRLISEENLCPRVPPDWCPLTVDVDAVIAEIAALPDPNRRRRK